MEKPLVSIVIPVYNGSNYLSQAIDSALNQTYSNIEVIVINDGSTDNGKTESICLMYGSRIKYISKSNGGVASAINMGIRVMNGKYVSWLSHDDLYLPNKIERQIAFIDELHKNGIDVTTTGLVYSGAETINSNGKVIMRRKYPSAVIQDKYYVLSKLSSFGVCGCATLIPKYLFEQIGYFDEAKKTTQDVDFWLRVVLSGFKYYYLNDYLIQNRRHSLQTSRVLDDEWMSEIEQFEKELMVKVYDISDCRTYNIWRGVAEYMYTKGSRSSKSIVRRYLKLITSNSKYYSVCQFDMLKWRIKSLFRGIVRYLFRTYLAK